jgi:hypothetical protein
MKVYETILSILEKNGPLPIPIICNEVNQVLSANREKPILPSHIKSIVTRIRDLFHVFGGKLSIHLDNPCTFRATLKGIEGVSIMSKFY